MVPRGNHRHTVSCWASSGSRGPAAACDPSRGEGLTYRSVVPALEGNPAQASALQQTRSERPGRPDPRPFRLSGDRERGGEGETDTEAGMLSAEASSAICVQRFDDSHYLQFTLRIAFRCVLHRYGSQDIRC